MFKPSFLRLQRPAWRARVRKHRTTLRTQVQHPGSRAPVPDQLRKCSEAFVILGSGPWSCRRDKYPDHSAARRQSTRPVRFHPSRVESPKIVGNKEPTLAGIFHSEDADLLRSPVLRVSSRPDATSNKGLLLTRDVEANKNLLLCRGRRFRRCHGLYGRPCLLRGSFLRGGLGCCLQHVLLGRSSLTCRGRRSGCCPSRRFALLCGPSLLLCRRNPRLPLRGHHAPLMRGKLPGIEAGCLVGRSLRTTRAARRLQVLASQQIAGRRQAGYFGVQVIYNFVAFHLC